MTDSDIAPEQCRAARAYLGWGRQELADRSRMTDATVLRFELRRAKTTPAVRAKIRRAFEEAGVTFDGTALVLPWTREAGV